MSSIFKKIPNLSNIPYSSITFVFILLIVIAFISWLFHTAKLRKNSCDNLDNKYAGLSNNTYLRNDGSVKQIDIFDASNSKLINYHVKSAYNCCCGGEYKNNFVALCALKQCISNGCRFLDFEIYSYNNEPIVASSTANNNYIKETYNALLLNDVLITISGHAFIWQKTNCFNDPLILNFRVMSTNIDMLVKMGDLIEEHLDISGSSSFTLLNEKDNGVLMVEMKTLYKKIIIICTFNPDNNIVKNSKLVKLKNYINLIGNGLYCNTYRYNDIIAKLDGRQLNTYTRQKFIIVLPNLDNSIKNFDSSGSFTNGCQAICMKHQNLDTNLDLYIREFEVDGKFSWKFKAVGLRNEVTGPISSTTGTSIGRSPGWSGNITFVKNAGGGSQQFITIKTEAGFIATDYIYNSGSNVFSVSLANPSSYLYISMSNNGSWDITNNLFSQDVGRPTYVFENNRTWERYTIPSQFMGSNLTYNFETYDND